MTGDHFELIGLIAFWGIALLGTRDAMCKKARFWSLALTLFGTSILTINIITHCIGAYLAGITTIEWDQKIIVDTLLLRIPSRMTVFGYFFVALGIESFVVCKYFQTTVLPKIWDKILLVFFYLLVIICIGMLLSIVFSVYFI
ncbi:MAG: hypothetical protein KAR83_05095 [Thermodesulfovibrionales bacterium]|nr:hypothetical protein [Thermodesulfovibrionales bacterium]